MTELMHYGMPRRSGRYPWGSGDEPFQSSMGFLGYVNELRKKGLSDTDIVKAVGLSSTTELRAFRTVAGNEKRAADVAQAIRLLDKGYSKVEIGKVLGVGESQVRNLLKNQEQVKAQISVNIKNTLKDEVDSKKYLDIGFGTQQHLMVSKELLNTAVVMLEAEGYKRQYVKQRQAATGEMTNMVVLTPPGVEWKDVINNMDKIRTIATFSDDGGRTIKMMEPPKLVAKKRVAVRYNKDGGADKDGVIEIRRGVKDLDLGNSRYAQVRIAIEGDKFLKGMAVYSDDVPPGKDILFNTNKNSTGEDADVFKKFEKDPENPFGSSIERQNGALNIVREEGQWETWNRTLSSQVLSKQSANLAKNQLEIAYGIKRADLDEILTVNNPVIKKRLLTAFGDEADSASVYLKAAHLPGQESHVILPVPSLRDNEIYAPKYMPGTTVALIRYPHGGIFEIPELTVTHRNKEARLLMGTDARDAVGINPKVASILSGADFDGDTVLVIPNNPSSKNKILTRKPLVELENFDPRTTYPGYEGMPKLKDKRMQTLMGDVSNLITDMTIKGAPYNEIAKAVRHSMVVIDSEKHNLNYKQSYIDHGIATLKERYQNRKDAGAATLISRAKSGKWVPQLKPRPAALGGPIDAETGKKVFIPTDREDVYRNVNKETGEITTRIVKKTEKRPYMSLVDDARDLSSVPGTPVEAVYAAYANKMKALGNEARLATLKLKGTPMSSSAKETYANERARLTAALRVAEMNAPLERQAQIIAQASYKLRTQNDPDLDDDDKKRIRNQELRRARARTGAGKNLIEISDREWEAIQAGAISTNQLEKIIRNSDLDKLRERATPRTVTGMSPAKLSRAKTMLANGYPQSEVANLLGVSVSTLSKAIRS